MVPLLTTVSILQSASGVFLVVSTCIVKLSAMASSSVGEMAHQIERLVHKPSWEKDANIKGDLMKVLGKLTTVRVDVDLLKSTGIGKWVKKLTKYDDDVVRGYSSSLTEKWKSQVGVPSEKPAKRPDSAGRNNSSNSSGGRDMQASADPDRFERARKKLQDKYAEERAHRDARTVQVLNRPMTTKKRGTTISAAPSRSSVGSARSGLSAMSLQQRRPMSAATRAPPPGRSIASSTARRPLPQSTNSRRPATAPSLSADEARNRKRERLLALAEQAKHGDSRGSVSIQRAPMSRLPQRDDTPTSRQATYQPVDKRKAMLDRMIPRVCGVSEPPKQSKSTTPGTKSPAASTGSKKKQANYSEGQREVLQWLKALDVDMSSYAPAFFDNGFDSIKLLNSIELRDLEKMVPKAGHQRMIEKALKDLKRKQSTAVSSRPRSATRDRDRDDRRRKPQSDPYFDEESDDSFVVSDGDEYAPGAITAMLRKGRKRRYSIDSTDSFNMEASYADIQQEEERSKRIGEYEDYREELRNKKMLKKSK